MPNYLELNYNKEEYGPNMFPQKLCDYLIQNYFSFSDDSSPKVLLDIGSGKGNALVGFQRRGLKVKGIDKREECIEILSDFDIRECNLENEAFPFENNYFDYVYSKSVFEHVYNTQNIIKEIYRVLKPGGISVQLTPDWATDYKIFWDDPTHVKPFTRKGLQNAFMLNEFIEVRAERFYMLPFLWKYPKLIFITKLIALLPDRYKWKDKEERVQRVLIRHSKERMLLVSAKKPTGK
jgi:ubiquinone/menaquinone biosynthesis C-methylase UbiE